ncbi:MAG: hypothetical protein HYV60_19795 [Planctomycetia bacterium]|nr:hypothetical protein [Planctomycetia bacterium]
MAKVDILRTPTGTLALFYNLDAAVGPGCANRRDDVVLVQFFLREAYKANPLAFPGGPLVDINGKPDTATFTAIRCFQKAWGAIGTQDGQVDPATGKAIASISKTQYTIVNLNLTFRGVRPQDYPKLSQVGPIEIRHLLVPPKFLGEV